MAEKMAHKIYETKKSVQLKSCLCKLHVVGAKNSGAPNMWNIFADIYY